MPRAKRAREESAAAGAADGGAEEEASSSSAVDATERQVYVEGIPYSAQEADIAKFFAGCGDIELIKAPKYQDTGRLRGYAHVTFKTAAGATKALERDGRYIGERFLSVERARPTNDNVGSSLALASRPRPKGCSTIFVRGLPYEIDEEAVKAAFSSYGKIVSVRLPRWNNTGRLKGVGYAQFESGLSCEAAMKAFRTALERGSQGLTVGSRQVQLDYDTGAPRNSFKTATGQSFFKTEEAAVVKKQLPKAHAASSSSSSSSSGGGGKSSKKPKHSRDDGDDDDEDSDS